MSNESIKSPAISDNSLVPSLNYINARRRAKFDGQCLKKDRVTFTHNNGINIYIDFEINKWHFRRDDFTLKMLCLEQLN